MNDPAHPDPLALASYLDGTLRRADQASVESHLADCRACRSELLEAGRIQRTARFQARRLWPLVPAAAAASLVLVLASGDDGGGARGGDHREPAIVSSEFPAALAPRGSAAAADTFHWSRLPGVDRYEVTLFDAEGHVLWKTSLPDTAASLPGEILLQPSQSYFWRVRARVGWNRWAESDLAEFRRLEATSP